MPAAAIAFCLSGPAFAQITDPDIVGPYEPPLPDLVAAGIVNGEQGLEWATILGKALFWDMQVGSEGEACASCHFSAGADSRITNQLNPDVEAKPDPDKSFGDASGMTASGGIAGPNYTLTAEDFPFHQLLDKTDRNSAIVFDMNDRVSSAGSYENELVKAKVTGGGAVEKCRTVADIYHMRFRNRDVPVRAVEPRNTPTTINAVFNFNNFWDGRASNYFNGKDALGKIQADNDPLLKIVTYDGAFGLERLELRDASLASQAVGPPLSGLEMSCGGRVWPFVGAKLLNNSTTPLVGQKVSRRDSLLGPVSNAGNKELGASTRGLTVSYKKLIKRAFNPRFWEGKGFYNIVPDGYGGAELEQATRRTGYKQMELNFSMFFGLSVMLYEATLISDQSRMDTAMKSCVTLTPGPGSAIWDGSACLAQAGEDGQPLLTQEEIDGARLFTTGAFGPPQNGLPPLGGNCALCHDPASMFTDAGYFAGQTFDPVTPLPLNNPPHDEGWNNLGGRPVGEDLANGADFAAAPLSVKRSMTLQARDWLIGGLDPDFTPFFYSGADDPEICADFPTWNGASNGVPVGPVCLEDATAVDATELPVAGVLGAVKVPGIRNVGLTPPYFHYGGYANLHDMLEFYARGGNRVDLTTVDGSGAPVDCAGVAVNGRNDTSGAGLSGLEFPVADGDCPSTGTEGIVTELNLRIDPSKGDLEAQQEYGIEALAAFMKALTDPRVQCDEAPFDHPELFVTHGHKPNGKEIVVRLPPVGAAGYDAKGRPDLCLPNEGDLFAEGMQNRVTKGRIEVSDDE